MKVFFRCVVPVLFLSACATVSLKTRKVIANSGSLPSQVLLKDVPFVQQDKGYCGPASLTMAMASAGAHVTLGQLTPEVYTPANKGSLQLDLVSSTRRHGLMAVAVSELHDLLMEVASGHPVLVFENLGLSWWPDWHYAVVTGYDLPKEKMILHSGERAFEPVDMERFEFAWRLAGNWGLVILPPDVLSASGDDLAHVKAAAGLEQVGRLRDAKIAYRTILERWPKSLGALIGMGNVRYSQKDFQGAVQVLDLATRIAPESETARHNLAVAKAALRSN